MSLEGHHCSDGCNSLRDRSQQQSYLERLAFCETTQKHGDIERVRRVSERPFDSLIRAQVFLRNDSAMNSESWSQAHSELATLNVQAMNARLALRTLQGVIGRQRYTVDSLFRSNQFCVHEMQELTEAWSAQATVCSNLLSSMTNDVVRLESERCKVEAAAAEGSARRIIDSLRSAAAISDPGRTHWGAEEVHHSRLKEGDGGREGAPKTEDRPLEEGWEPSVLEILLTWAETSPEL